MLRSLRSATRVAQLVLPRSGMFRTDGYRSAVGAVGPPMVDIQVLPVLLGHFPNVVVDAGMGGGQRRLGIPATTTRATLSALGCWAIKSSRVARSAFRRGPELVSLHLKGNQRAGLVDHPSNLTPALQPAPAKVGHGRQLQYDPCGFTHREPSRQSFGGGEGDKNPTATHVHCLAGKAHCRPVANRQAAVQAHRVSGTPPSLHANQACFKTD